MAEDDDDQLTPLDPKVQEFARNWMERTFDPRVLHIEGGGPGIEPPELPQEFYEARLGRPVAPPSLESEGAEPDESPLVALARPQPRPAAPQSPPTTLQVADRQASFRGHSVILDDEEHAVVAAVILSAVQKRLNAQLGEIQARLTPAVAAEPPKRKRGRPRKAAGV